MRYTSFVKESSINTVKMELTQQDTSGPHKTWNDGGDSIDV